MIHVGDRLPVESPLLKQTEQIDFVCGEKTGEWFVHGKLQAKSPEAARQVKQVAEGLLAMARLRQAGDADPLKLLDRVEFRVDDRTIELDFRAPAADVARAREKAMDLFFTSRATRRPLSPCKPRPILPSNEDLAARRSGGCMPSFEELLRRFQVPLLHFLRHVGPESDAEDVLQETVSAGLLAIEPATGRSGGSRPGCSRSPGEPASTITGGRGR